MSIKKIHIILVLLLNFLIGNTNSWGLDITAQAQSNSGEMIGISDYVRIKMQAAEPFEDCGIDRCCDKFEDGFGGCLNIEGDWGQGIDPNGDNFHPIDNPNGYEKNGVWDGDIYNDCNQNCIQDICCLDLNGDGDTNDEDECNEEAYIDRVNDGVYTLGEKYFNQNSELQIDESLDYIYPDCKYEEGGTDGWRQGEDEFDIPAPMDGHTNIRFSHLDWMNQVDVNGNTCCMEGIYFSVDKRSWKNHDEVAQWDIYGNTWQLGNDIDRIKFSWDNNALDTLFWEDDNSGQQNPYEIYIFSDDNEDGKFNSDDTYVNMNTSQYFAVDPEFLISNGEGARISIVLGECALEGTDEYVYDNDGDGWSNSNCIDCPKEFCPGSYTGEYYAICQSEYCINDPTSQQYITCPDNFSFDRVLNVKNIEIDIENNSLSNAETSYPGGGDGTDIYLTVCKYNEEIKFSNCGQVRDEFKYGSDGEILNEDNLFLDHTCTTQYGYSPPECEFLYDEDGIEHHINTNVWWQKWYKVDDVVVEDTNDNIYCETNAVDYCNVCATTDEVGICQDNADECNNNSDCNPGVECISDGIYEDFNENLDCFGVCFGPAEIDDCGKCQSDILNGNFTSIVDEEGNAYEHFILGPDVDCNGECKAGTPEYDLQQNEGNYNYGKADFNSCGICSGGNTIHQQELEIDECGVCPQTMYAEPFFDANVNGIWDDGEEYLDLIDDNIFTQINSEYFYGENCWIDVNNDGEWNDEDDYIDHNGNGIWDCYIYDDQTCLEWDNNVCIEWECLQWEPFQDPVGDGYTPAEPFKLPGECIQIDDSYYYNNGPNCDNECFNDSYTIFSQALFDDCGTCSCLNGLIDNNESFCNVNHLPNSGNSEPGEFEENNSCIDSIFYNLDQNGQLINSIQDFTALSNPVDNNQENDQVILEWFYNPEIFIDDAIFIIHQFDSLISEWNNIDTTFVPSCIDDGSGYTGICSNNSEQCQIENNGSDCKIIHIIDDTYTGVYGIEINDSYNNSSGILATATAQEFFTITYEFYNGNNLISFYGMPNDANVSIVFESIEEHLYGIIGEGVASSHLGDGHWVGAITELNSFSGYWLKVNYPDMNGDGLMNDPLTFNLNESYPVESDYSYQLQTGANLLSYLGEDAVLISDAINDQIEPYFNRIIGEGYAAMNQDMDGDGISDSWLGSLQMLYLKKGYWVILNLNNCIENGDCWEDQFGNAILNFKWE